MAIIFSRETNAPHKALGLLAADLQLSGDELIEALNRYQHDWIDVQPPRLTYLSSSNANNFVPGLPKFDLCHVLNISSLLRRIRSRPGRKDAYANAKAILAAPGEASKALTLDLLKEQFALRGNRPIFAARRTDFKKHANVDQPDTWNRAVGVMRAPNEIQLVLRYSAQIVAARTDAIHGRLPAVLVRPTQAESRNREIMPGALVKAVRDIIPK